MTPLKPTGFWSYTSADDAASDGRLSRLRIQLANRLRVQLGRPVHLFQDVAAIPTGTLWQQQIESALAEASFFIPIITPGFLQSKWCTREVRLFRAHMEARGRNDLILPIHYIDVGAFFTVRRGDCFDPEVLDYLRSLQWIDFRALEPVDANTSEVRIWLAEFARRIEQALWRVTPPPADPEPPDPQAVERRLARAAPNAHTPAAAEAHAPNPDPKAADDATPGPLPAKPSLRSAATASPVSAGGRKRWIIGGAVGLAAVVIGIFAIHPETEAPSRVPPPAASIPAKPDPAPVTLPAPSPPDHPAPSEPEKAPSSPRELRDICPSTAICPEMVLIPHGTFQMGTTDEELAREEVPDFWGKTEKPRHPVTIATDFYMGKYDVTVGEFKAFVQAKHPTLTGGCYSYEKGNDGNYNSQNKPNGTWENPGFPQTDRDPAVCVSYADAQSYVDWLNTITVTKSYRLPSEAEWEYAARAGTYTARFWGDSRDPACRFANVADRTFAKELKISSADPKRLFACDDGFAFTAPVGTYRPNPFKLYDILGNVWQWTADCWNQDYNGAPQDSAVRTTGDCSRRVVRGGSWDINPWVVRAGDRYWNYTGYRFTFTGFRVARTL